MSKSKVTAIVLSIAAAGVLGAGASASTTQARQATRCPHPATIKGASVLISCGPAKATLHFAHAPLALTNGQCVKSSSNFGLNFGAIVDGPNPGLPPDSFQLISGPQGGTATLQIARNGKQYIGSEMKLKLASGRTKGTLSGIVTWAAGTPNQLKAAVSGSFTC